MKLYLCKEGSDLRVLHRWKLLWQSLLLCTLVWLGTSASAHAACSAPNLLLVLDRSCSMAGTNWNTAVNAANTVTNRYNGKLRFGLETFQSSASINYGIDRCIRDGSRCVANLQAVLRGIRVSGGTNLRRAIDTARSHLTAIRNADPAKTRKMSVMFITDGRSSCADANVRTLLSSLGVKTYVIGFGRGVDTSCLNNMATAGGTARSSSRKYYQADNSSELNTAMAAIANAATAEVCNNLDDDCDGVIDEGLRRSCRTACGTGTEICSRGRWVNCSARSPITERCNGVDDDCDGRIDENWSSKGQTCYAGTGNCRRSGRYICNSAQNGLTCSARPGSPSSEKCNGQDDDCDGRIDENWPQKGQSCTAGKGICARSGVWVCNGTTAVCSARPGGGRSETCNNLDDDCDGSIDEGLRQACRNQCGTGTETCSAGRWVNCNARTPTAEKCNGLDDDCDGRIDENFTNKNTTCYAGTGACRRAGRYVCNSSQNGTVCNARAGSGSAEKCNGIDDDCDGRIDEDFTTKGRTCNAGTGGCQRSGTYVCRTDGNGVQCSAPSGQPKPETCNNFDDDCDGSVDEGLTRSCSTPCNSGTETCSAGQWVNCTARKPVTETCNGKDDDCDGKIDEDWAKKNTSCKVGIGACERTGKWVCTSNETDVECSAKPGNPGTEICNNKDDDCDGSVDEGVSQSCKTQCESGTEVCQAGKWVNCTARKPTKELCNGLDDDCDGSIDEDWSKKNTSCSVGVGNCTRTGVWVCNGNGSGLECSAQPGPPVKESCNNQDDDCDGQIDEDWSKKGSLCTVGVGGCTSSGVWVCKQDGSGIECSATPGKPQPERCNGKDDDCDGSIDEDWANKGKNCTNGQGICVAPGIWVCKKDESDVECNATPGVPQAETCNNKDDDCDGTIDEALLRPCKTICGAGNETCQAGQWVNCDAQKPVAEMCNGKDDDCNGLIDDKWPTKNTSCTVGTGACERKGKWQCNTAQDGVECSAQPGPPSSELCDDIDNDCDGQIDEDWPDKGKPCNSGTGACNKNGKQVCTPDGSKLRCSSPGGAPSSEICDGVDNDCNGIIDDGLVRACKTQCGSGVETCSKGRWQNCSAQTPSPETCNGQDDDCDGQIDQGLTRICETACGKGKETCSNGRWQNCTAPQPEKEICDALDNDCNGQIDELPAKQCLGDCGRGKAICDEGNWTGCSGPAPKTEVCNGKDDDCDGRVDDGLSRPCRSDCGLGNEICQGGQWTLCSAPAPQPEVCNGRDDNCDGKSDNNATCPQGLQCIQGSCRPRCRNGECPNGLQCISGTCFGDACKNVKCPSDKQCVGGRCVAPCDLIKCPTGNVCRNGNCIKDDCYVRGCPSGQRCYKGQCQKDPCDSVSCNSDQFCRDGKCINSCANVTCASDEFCEDGTCKKDPGKTGTCKDVTCPSGHGCLEGKCIVDPCYNVTCNPGQACQEGRCQHDPCHSIKCPDKQACVQGQCVKPPDNPNPEVPEEGGSSEASTSDAGGEPVEKPLVTEEDQPKDNTEVGDKKGGNNTSSTNPDVERYVPGCGCQQSNAPTPLFLLLLFALLLMHIRRRSF